MRKKTLRHVCLKLISGCLICMIVSVSASAIEPLFINDFECKGLNTDSITFESWSGLVNQTRWAIDYSANQWNNKTGITKLYHSPTQHNENTDSVRDYHNRITKVPFASDDNTAMYTRSWVVVKGEYAYIIEADIVINSNLPWNNTGSATCFDVQNCMTHELGHMLGLGHTENLEPTMYTRCAIGETKKRTIEDEDKEGFYRLYR